MPLSRKAGHLKQCEAFLDEWEFSIEKVRRVNSNNTCTMKQTVVHGSCTSGYGITEEPSSRR